jgi:hypothetical protein
MTATTKLWFVLAAAGCAAWGACAVAWQEFGVLPFAWMLLAITVAVAALVARRAILAAAVVVGLLALPVAWLALVAPGMGLPAVPLVLVLAWTLTSPEPRYR